MTTNNNCKPSDVGTTTGPFPLPPTNTNPASGTVAPLFPGSSIYCPVNPTDVTSAFQFILSNDACVQDQYLTEALNIGGAQINVYKLLGVHEQCKLVDSTGFGTAISGGDGGTYVAANAFDMFATEWHSAQTGSAVTASAYIGYDFGEIKTLDMTRRMYGIETSIRKQITAFLIKQDPNPLSRATQVRLEYSADSITWYGAGLATLPDDDKLNTILMKSSVPSRYWRLRPTKFNGSNTGNGTCTSTAVINGQTVTGNFGAYWGVQALQLVNNYIATEVQNIEDPILQENRDRDYATEPVACKGYYDLLDIPTELSRFGIELPKQVFSIQMSFSSVVALVGRPIVIGDLIELPSQVQYSPSMEPVKKWLEVQDVAWATNGFTPTWQPLLLKITASPAIASQETQDIFGNLAEEPVLGGLGLMDKGNGRNPNYQDFSDIAATIEADAKTDVPERGREGSGLIREFTKAELLSAQQQGLPAGRLNNIGLYPRGSYVEDAMPPNNLPFTEGTALPPIAGASDGEYFRVNYVGMAGSIPSRLYRYSGAKGRWIYLETDRRQAGNPTKPILQEFLISPTRTEESAILQRDYDEEC